MKYLGRRETIIGGVPIYRVMPSVLNWTMATQRLLQLTQEAHE